MYEIVYDDIPCEGNFIFLLCRLYLNTNVEKCFVS